MKLEADRIRLDNSVRELEREKSAADAAAAANQGLLQAKRAQLVANDQAILAEIDLAEQQDLAKAIGDPERQAEVRRIYARQREDHAHAMTGRQLKQGLEDAKASRAAAVADKETAQATLAAWDKEGAAFADERQALEARRQALFDSGRAYYGRFTDAQGNRMIFTRDAEASKFIRQGYQAELTGISAREADYKKRRTAAGIDANAALAIQGAEGRIAVADANIATQRALIANHEGIQSQLIQTRQETTERQAQWDKAQREEAQRQREKAKQEAEEAKAAARAKRIQEADADAAKEAGDVTALQDEAAATRAGLDARYGEVQRARQAHASALQRRSTNSARMGSMYGGSFTAAQDEGAILRSAQSMQRAEEAFNQAAEAAEKFFKTFDAALKREQGEADRAAQRAKAARETN